jgi:hypothetical protein
MLLIEALKQHCHIYCISLENRNDRYESACKELDKIGLKDFVYFHRPKLHEKGGFYGNFESVLWCLNDSLNKDPSKLILIFEDDICFSVSRVFSIQFPSIFINNTDKWDTIRLGYWKGIFIERLYEDIIKTQYYRGNCRGTHAVLWSPLFAQKVLKYNVIIEENNVMDWYLAKITGRHYLLNRGVCFQKPGFESNTQWFYKNIQNIFQENPIKFQLKYQARTYNAWNWIGRFIPINWLAGILQIGLVMDKHEIFDMITKFKCYYTFKNKCLL